MYGLTFTFTVGVAGFRMNTALATYLRQRAEGIEAPAHPEPAADRPPTYVAATWRVADRLSDAQVHDLIESFKAGTAKHVLAKRYGISLTSVKTLLRSRGVRR